VTATIRAIADTDWEAVLAIYAEGIRGGNATFETEVPDWETWKRGHLEVGRHIVVEDGKVVGWVALAPVSPRPCYRGVADVSVYVTDRAQGRGVGRALLDAAIESSEAHDIWTLTAGIFPENEASLSVHEKCGFRRVGVRERIGWGLGRWRDVVLMERRSAKAGTPDPV
jgi:phosphinothricin acetyltransferase